MPDNSAFQAFYLRQIGVHTPLDLQAPVMEEIDSSVSDQPAVPHSNGVQTVDSLKPKADLKPTSPLQTQSFEGLEELKSQASTCTACSLAEERQSVVFGVGNPQADIVFIGEAPGREEDMKGEPFVGRAGKLLDRMLTAQGLDRSQVYIMNTVKCRPPNNRDPKPEEVQACGKWFDQQLKLLSPKMICLLGRVAAQTVLESDLSLSKLRSRWHDYHGIPVRVMYHPAYLLRSPQQKRHAWSDLCLLKQRL